MLQITNSTIVTTVKLTHLQTHHVNPFTADPVKALHYAILV